MKEVTLKEALVYLARGHTICTHSFEVKKYIRLVMKEDKKECFIKWSDGSDLEFYSVLHLFCEEKYWILEED